MVSSGGVVTTVATVTIVALAALFYVSLGIAFYEQYVAEWRRRRRSRHLELSERVRGRRDPDGVVTSRRRPWSVEADFLEPDTRRAGNRMTVTGKKA